MYLRTLVSRQHSAFRVPSPTPATHSSLTYITMSFSPGTTAAVTKMVSPAQKKKNVPLYCYLYNCERPVVGGGWSSSCWLGLRWMNANAGVVFVNYVHTYVSSTWLRSLISNAPAAGSRVHTGIRGSRVWHIRRRPLTNYCWLCCCWCSCFGVLAVSCVALVPQVAHTE